MDIVILVSSQEVDITLIIESFLQALDHNIGATQAENSFLRRCALGMKVFDATIDNRRQLSLNTMGRAEFYSFSQRNAKYRPNRFLRFRLSNVASSRSFIDLRS